MRAKRILFLADLLGNGGAERQLTLLVRHLPAPWQPVIWSFNGGPYVEVIQKMKIPLHIEKRRWRFDPFPILKLWLFVIKTRPALIHSWGWVSSLMIGPLCKILNIPFVDGSIRIGWAPPNVSLRARIAFALADRVIANSYAGLSAWNISFGKGRVVYNGFDPSRLALIKSKPNDREYFNVVMAARMEPVKDFASFIQAARLVSAQTSGQPWRFLALGAGSDRSALIEGASDLIEKGIISFVDAGLEIFPYLHVADIGVLMTNPDRLAEGCSNTILEYMILGLPVVCSDSGGNREVVTDGKTGFIVPPMNASALADRLIWLQQHSQIAAEMGQASAQRVLTEFTVQNLVQKMVSIYEELVH